MERKLKKVEYTSKEQTIGMKITELRVKYNVSQKEMAKKLGKTQQFVSKLESSRQSPTATTLQKVAKIFKKKLRVDFE